MTGLRLAGLPGLAGGVEVEPGRRQAVVLPDARVARRLADLATGLRRVPAGGVVEASGPTRLVPADGGLLPHLTVLGNLLHGHRTGPNAPRDTALEQCTASAGRLGLDDVLERHPHEITAGRRRLAGIARALSAHPCAIVLEDSPGLPTWGSLLDAAHDPDILSAGLLLITGSRSRAAGFTEAGHD
jgi:ABC-type taurine transport system ATPase subunit